MQLTLFLYKKKKKIKKKNKVIHTFLIMSGEKTSILRNEFIKRCGRL